MKISPPFSSQAMQTPVRGFKFEVQGFWFSDRQTRSDCGAVFAAFHETSAPVRAKIALARSASAVPKPVILVYRQPRRMLMICAELA
jgi:hypothetical protein